MNRIRTGTVALLVALVIGGATAFAQTTTITVVAETGPEGSTIAAAAKAFMQAHPDIKVDVVQLGRDGYFQRLSNQLFAKSSAYDVVAMTNVQVGQFAASGVLKKLDDYVSNSAAASSQFSLDNFVPSALALGKLNGNFYALPFTLSTEMLFYRTDLIKNPPQTWSDYLSTAQKFTKSVNADSPTKFGTTIQGQYGSIPPKEWAQYLWSYGGKYLDNGEVAFDSPAGVKALTFYGDLLTKYHVVPPDVTSYGYTEALQAFQQGVTAMALEWDAATPTFLSAKDSPKISDKFAATPVPGVKQADGTVLHTPYIQSWVLTINQFSKNPDAAFKFMSFAFSPANPQWSAVPGEWTAFLPVLSSDKIKSSYGKVFPVYEQSLKLGRAFPNSKCTGTMANAVDFAISKVLAGQSSPQSALQTAAGKTKACL